MKKMSQEGEWSKMYKEFRSIYPNLKKNAVGYSPIDQALILIHLVGGSRMIYDGVTHRAKIMSSG